MELKVERSVDNSVEIVPLEPEQKKFYRSLYYWILHGFNATEILSIFRISLFSIFYFWQHSQ